MRAILIIFSAICMWTGGFLLGMEYQKYLLRQLLAKMTSDQAEESGGEA